MATNIYSSSPQVILEGIRDESIRVVTPEPVSVPQHLPFFYVFSEKGHDDRPYIVSGTSLVNTFGEKFLDINSKYATHSTPFIQGLMEQGSTLMIQRLKPENAKTAWLRFSLEVTQRDITKEETYTEEVADPKDNTKKITVSKTRMVVDEDMKSRGPGYYLKWVINPRLGGVKGIGKDDNPTVLSDDLLRQYNEITQFGKGFGISDIGRLDDKSFEKSSVLTSGITVNGTDVSRIYPILDLEVTNFGEYGNNLGVRLSAPNWKSAVRPDRAFFENTLLRPFRIEFVKRSNKRSPTVSIRNFYGEATSDFVFKRGAINPLAGNEDMYLGTSILDLYRNTDTSFGRVPTYGPFDKIKVYDENIEHIVKMLYAREALEDKAVAEAVEKNPPEKGFKLSDYTRLMKPSDVVEGLEEDAHWQIDFVEGKNFEGTPYRTIKVLGMAEGARQEVNSVTEHWAVDGDDGIMNLEVYNRMVESQLLQFDDEAHPLLDLARYPFSVFYDTGYDMETKKAMNTLTRNRKNVSTAFTTHIVPTRPTNESSDSVGGVEVIGPRIEAGRIRQITQFARMFPESTVYNTKALRANIIMQCGTIIGHPWKGRVPMTYELAMKRAAYMGAKNGKMVPGYGYDQDGIKQLRYMKQVSNPWIPQPAKEINWTNGATWAQYYDHNLMFFPAVRTIYKEDTSVLLSDINMLIATDLENVCFRVWRRLVGNSRLSNAEFASMSDQYILEDVEGRYDGRVTIVPRTYFTKGDEQRGYSWHCEIHMYAANMKTVGVMTVVTHRIEDLQG